MISKHNSLGRLGFILTISVLGSACAVGEIGDSAGAPRLDVGFDDAALACPGVSPDVSVSDGWQSKEASQPAPDSLYFEVMARPSEANLGALVAVGAQDIHDLSDAAITVRFSESGVVDAMDEIEYSSDGFFEYDSGVWYNIAISADVTARTYDVEVGRCGEKRQNVIRGARFRTEANVYDRLSTWGVWSSRLASLQLSTPTWMASGTCAPATCEALGSECGQPGDGCNGTLNCGVCGGGQLCSSGACVDEPVSAPPPPSCTPASCQSLGAECGAPSDGCDGTLNCGFCGAGQLCSNYVCVDEPITPPPVPPECVPTTCQALGAECGVRSNGCGGTLNCGGCGAGQLCSDSLCIDQPVTPPPPPPPSSEPAPQPAPGVTETFYATRTNCMRPCAVQFDAQKAVGLSWPEVRDSEYVWDFDDGGSRTDSEGFLAAVVYERAGTFHPTVTVDGETWNPQTITVLEPTRTVCVGTDFSDCPSSSGSDHFSTLNAALNNTSGAARRHILLERGGSYGALPEGNATPTMIGAYSTGAKPAVTVADVDLTANWSFVDLAISGSGGKAISTKGSGGLLLRVTGTGAPSNSWIDAYNGAFIVDSSIVSAAPYTVFPFDNCPWYVIKNSTIDRTSSGQHTIRIDGDGQERVLIQDSRILGAGQHTTVSIRGTSSWLLVQDNFFNQPTGTSASQPGDSRVQSKIVFERNTYDRQNGNTGTDWGFRFQGHDMIVRNNIVYNNGGQFDYAAVSGDGVTTRDIWFINNTSVGNDTDGFRCGNTTGCVLSNNLVYSTSAPWGDCIIETSGATLSNNWCYTDDECLDPVTGGSGCHNPNFVSQTYGNQDFMRPGAGTRGIDAGYPTAPVWNDYDKAPRTTIDVGAVER